VDERFLRLLRRQQASGFDDVRGAEASVTVPVSERLLNEAITDAMPPSAPVRDLSVKPIAGDRFAVRARIGSSAFLPAFNVTLTIHQQPAFPASPVLVLTMEGSGLLSFAGPALRFLDALPPGIRVDHDRILVDLATLLEARGLGGYLQYVDDLRINTVEGAVLVSFRASIKR
jgi:hypothetical protein